jgi:hypothetical protein
MADAAAGAALGLSFSSISARARWGGEGRGGEERWGGMIAGAPICACSSAALRRPFRQKPPRPLHGSQSTRSITRSAGRAPAQVRWTCGTHPPSSPARPGPARFGSSSQSRPSLGCCRGRPSPSPPCPVRLSLSPSLLGFDLSSQ